MGQPLGGYHAFEVSPGPFRARIGREEFPEAWSVSGDEQMGEFVDEDVVDDVLGHALEAVREADAALGGVQDPQRVFWLVTHRTDTGRARPSKYWSDRRWARSASSASPRARLLSWAASLSSMTFTQRCSSASDMRAGMSTTVRSPSRYAETVLRRRALLRTSIALTPEPLGGWLVVLRCGVPARCSGSAGTPRRYPLHTGKSRLRDGSVPPPPPAAGFVRRIPAPVDNFRRSAAGLGMLDLVGEAMAGPVRDQGPLPRPDSACARATPVSGSGLCTDPACNRPRRDRQGRQPRPPAYGDDLRHTGACHASDGETRAPARLA